MKLILKSLNIENFKGIKKKEMIFDDLENFVAARNGGGKTTLFDAYCWLLTGKDSSDTVKFQIKPIIDGKQAERVDNIVEGYFFLDGNPLTLKKVHSEKYKRPRGQKEEIFDGNETAYFWNNDIITEGVYLANLSKIIDLNKLKLFSNSGFFHSLSEQERRNILVDIAGANDIDSLVASSPNYAFIGEFLNQKITFKEKKASIANNKKRTKDELSGIPSRIDELTRSNVLLERPFDRLNEDLQKKVAELSGIENSINDKNAARKKEDEEIEALRKEKRGYEDAMDVISKALQTSIAAARFVPDETKLQLEQEIKKDQGNLKTISEEIEQLVTRISNGQKTIDSLSGEIENANELATELGKQWDNENESTIEFKEDEFTCKTCKREFDKSDIAAKQKELISNFNANKAKMLDDIASKGIDITGNKLPKLKADLAKYTSALDVLSTELAVKRDCQDEIKSHLQGCEMSLKNHKPKEDIGISEASQLDIELNENIEYLELLQKAANISLKIEEFKPADNSILIERKKELSADIDELKKELANKATISANSLRIQELKEQESRLNQSLADLESQEITMQQFIFKQMDEVQKKVNGLFSFVQFQMFDKQVNGEIIDACITLVNGKPVQKNAVNTADEVNAGVDIINTLSRHYNVFLPMWIDKRESVTNLIPSETQIINLSVNPDYDTVTLIK